MSAKSKLSPGLSDVCTALFCEATAQRRGPDSCLLLHHQTPRGTTDVEDCPRLDGSNTSTLALISTKPAGGGPALQRCGSGRTVVSVAMSDVSLEALWSFRRNFGSSERTEQNVGHREGQHAVRPERTSENYTAQPQQQQSELAIGGSVRDSGQG